MFGGSQITERVVEVGIYSSWKLNIETPRVYESSIATVYP